MTISLPLFSGALRYFDGGMHVGSGADADQDAFFLGNTASHREGVVIAHLHAFHDLRPHRLSFLRWRLFGTNPAPVPWIL